MFCNLILQVAGVPMTVLKTTTIFEKKWLTTQIHAGAACPILEGNVWRAVNGATATTDVMSLVSLGIWGCSSLNLHIVGIYSWTEITT